MNKSILKSLLVITFLISSLPSFAAKIHERVELMKYAIAVESALPHETKWEVTWLEQFKLIQEAYAYREGETCLVLGFKSQYKQGKCRLSSAEGIKDYKKQCSGDSLPCNPKIFGKPSPDQPFCISKNSGKELSKYCAKETFNHLAEKSNSPALKDIAKMSAKAFDLSKIDLSKMDKSLSDAFSAVFKDADSDLESAVKFTRELCEDLKLSTKRGHQPFDVRTCEGHLALLEKGKTPVAETKSETPKEKKEENKEEKTKVAEEEKKVDEKKDEKSDVVQMDMPDEECVDPLLDKKVEENIQDVKNVADQEEAKAWLLCINKIEAHSKVAPQLKDIAEHSKERDRYFGYWHQLDGQKQFGLLCNPKSDNDSHEVFTFLGPNGFSQVQSPANEYTGVINRMSYKNKEYYIVQDMLGEYFELHEKSKLTSAPKGTQDDIKKFHKQGQGSIAPLEPVPADKIVQAKMCIRQRIDEYVDWITYPRGVLPNVADYNADVKIYNDSVTSGKDPREALKGKYTRTVDEIKKEYFAGVIKDLPECQGIISEEDFSRQFDKDHEERIKLHNKFRSILELDKN